MKVICDLNERVEKLLPEVEEVYLFDDDDCSLLMWCCLNDPKNPGANIERVSGLKTLTNTMTAQVSIYTMPNGKKVAVCYPTSNKVNYNKFDDKIRELFAHVDDRRNWHRNAYSFFLYCTNNGYDSLIKEKPHRLARKK